MKRLFPSSLLGQVMLVLAIGLLVGQAISAVLLYRAGEQRHEANMASSIAFRLLAADARTRSGNGIARERRAERRTRLEAFRRQGERQVQAGNALGRPLRLGIQRSSTSPITDEEQRLSGYEDALRDVLLQQNLVADEIVITRRLAGDDPFVRQVIANRPRLRGPGWENRPILVASIEQSNNAGWLVARLAEPKAPRGALSSIVFQTLVIFAVLFALLFLVVRRMTRPLARLTERVDHFTQNPDRAIEIEEGGPADMRKLIAAHNAMEGRIAAMLDEKDVMLGAIGHDLKTPLAALRVRIESVPDDIQRERMAQSIEDITHTLDDILILARLGRSGHMAEPVELSALASGIVEEFEDLGQPVTMGDASRVVAPVQITWIKRALRNLVSNAVRYGGHATVHVVSEESRAIMRVEDDGPGIPANRMADMLEPFTRGESSRNRATGGTGLGLTLARAIADQHGGELVLNNRPEGGLRAELRLPLSH